MIDRENFDNIYISESCMRLYKLPKMFYTCINIVAPL